MNNEWWIMKLNIDPFSLEIKNSWKQTIKCGIKFAI